MQLAVYDDVFAVVSNAAGKSYIKRRIEMVETSSFGQRKPESVEVDQVALEMVVTYAEALIDLACHYDCSGNIEDMLNNLDKVKDALQNHDMISVGAMEILKDIMPSSTYASIKYASVKQKGI